MKYIIFVVGAAMLFPLTLNAQVVINEIAWMGTAVSASDEWIELYNRGAESVSLVGWKLVAEDGAPSISLSGSIDAGGFYLLERTDDTTVPDQTADKIYTGDLANKGETLVLTDALGAVIDTVIGGTDWKDVGGNNTTKDTAQRQSDDSWLTGVPTPKAENTTIESENPSGSSGGTPDSSGTKATPIPKKKTLPHKQVVFAYAGEDITAVAGADIRFEGYAFSDAYEHLYAQQVWTFGDGAVRNGKETFHTYAEPGTYLVVLTVHDKYQFNEDTLVVTVLPARVHIGAVERGDAGWIEIVNESDHELDISRWKLHVRYARGRKTSHAFVFPERTIILPHARVKIPNSISRLSPHDDDIITLQFPSGLPAGAYPNDTVEQSLAK